MPIKIKIDINNQSQAMLDRQQREFDKINQFAYKQFVNNTPRRTGNARRNTRLTDDGIEAAYAYAQQLDQGASRQAPDGMTLPTIQAVEKKFLSIVNRK